MDFLEQKLSSTNFVVGYGATLADLSISCCFFAPLKSLFNTYYSWKYPNLAGYLERMSLKFRLSKLPPSMTTPIVSINEMETRFGVTHFANFERDLKLGNITEMDFEISD